MRTSTLTASAATRSPVAVIDVSTNTARDPESAMTYSTSSAVKWVFTAE
jgi:hypothetical protein